MSYENLNVDDNYVMPFGIYKGKKITNVPADYLQWLYVNKKATPHVYKYWEDNEEILLTEIDKAKGNKYP